MNRLTRPYAGFPGSLLCNSARMVLLAMALALLAACASSQSADSSENNQRRKAAESNTALGLEYMNRGQYEVALGALKKAVKQDPDYAPAHTVMAVLYERIGEIKLAGQQYRKAYEADPTDGDVNNNFGVYLCQTGAENDGIDHLMKALEDPFYSSPSVALTNAGSCELGRGNLDQAEDFLRGALKIEPEFPDALMNMARLSFEQGDYLKSRAFMQRYEAVASHGAASLLLAYRIESASGDAKAAKSYKLSLESNFPKSDQVAELRGVSER